MRFGIDLGGTKTEIVAIDESGREALRRRIATPVADYGHIVTAIRDLVLAAEATLGLRGTVGVAIPGALSARSGLVKNANTIALIGHPLDKDLASALGRPVRLANDANCFALSEAIDGAAANCGVVFGIIAGTGIGGGVCVGGRLLEGAHGIAGEWGHNPLPAARESEIPGPSSIAAGAVASKPGSAARRSRENSANGRVATCPPALLRRPPVVATKRRRR
jgi:fructokinase